MNYRILERKDLGERFTVLHFTTETFESYSGVMQVIKTPRGDGTCFGFIDSMNGAGLYKLLQERMWEIFGEMGLSTLEADVSPAHARLMARSLRDSSTVTIIGEAEKLGVELLRVRIDKKHEIVSRGTLSK